MAQRSSFSSILVCYTYNSRFLFPHLLLQYRSHSLALWKVQGGKRDGREEGSGPRKCRKSGIGRGRRMGFEHHDNKARA